MYKSKTVSRILFSAVLMLTLMSSIILPYKQVEAIVETQRFQDEFIESIAPAAVTIAKSHGLFPSVMIAQAILESDWGRSTLSRPPYYNLFGIKGGEDGVIFDTLEDDGLGNYFGIRDSFRRYNSYLESLQDYAELFRSTPYLTRVYANFVNASTVEEACIALTGTYATDTRYGSKLMNIIVGYNLLKFDGKVNRAPSWQLQAKDDIVYSLYNEVNIRTDHSTDSEVIRRAQYGDAFRRLGTTTGWTLVQLADGQKAYIASEFLSTEQPPAEDSLDNNQATIDRLLQLKEKNSLTAGDNKAANNMEANPSDVAATQAKITDDQILSALMSGRELTAAEKAYLEGLGIAAKKSEKIHNAPAEPVAPKEPTVNTPTPEEVAAAKAAADAAIAEGPTAATKSGVLDSRTAGVKNEIKVDKSILESYLGSTVDLPFASDEVKAEYITTVKKAASLYWSKKATQKEINDVIAKLKELQAQAETEDAEGLKKDNERIRQSYGVLEGTNQTLPYTIHYSKLNLPGDFSFIVTKDRDKTISTIGQQMLRRRGQKWETIGLRIENEQHQLVPPQGKVEIEMPLPLGYASEAVELYKLNAQGEPELQKFQLKDNKLIVRTQELGDYVILEHNVLLQKARSENAVLAADEGDLGIVANPKVKVLYGTELSLVLLLLLLWPLGKLAWFKIKAMGR